MHHNTELTGKCWYEKAGDKHRFQLDNKTNTNMCGKGKQTTIIVMIFQEKLNNVSYKRG